MQAWLVGKGRVVEDIVEQICLEASAGNAVGAVVGIAEGTAAVLDGWVSDVVDFVAVEVMAQVACISE